MMKNIAMGCLLGIVTARGVFAVPPTINVTWGEPDPPVEGIHYFITDTDPDFPDVELVSESLTWRIWSTDSDNPDGIGDIGTISSPHPNNFAVSIKTDLGGPGARDIKGITLVPSSASNQSNIIDAFIGGQLTDDVTVQADTLGLGGEINLTVNGNATGEAGTLG